MVTTDQRISRYMDCLEPAVAGQHGHTTTLNAARHLVWDFGLSETEALPHFLAYNARCAPPWKVPELERKLRQALNYSDHKTRRGHLLGEEYSAPRETRTEETTQKRESSSRWPAPDLDAIRKITTTGWGLVDLWQESPLRFDDDTNHAEEIIDVLFPGNPLLCCGLAAYKFATRRREIWRGHLSRCAFITPNPMYKVEGLTQDGELSQHCKDATAARVYLAIEFDFAEFERDGKTSSKWAPLIQEWRAAGLSVLDAMAALHRHLKEYLPLVVATHSGGKSLHGLYAAFNHVDRDLRLFMRYAVCLGADPILWTRSQFSRVPDGKHQNGRTQTCYYLDPKRAVRSE